MADDWKAQLRSENPKIRAQAVKTLALSGDQSNLKILIEIGENDPDPRVQEYAKKAARHLYASSLNQTPAEPDSAIKSEPAPAPGRTLPKEEPTPTPAPHRTLPQEKSEPAPAPGRTLTQEEQEPTPTPDRAHPQEEPKLENQPRRISQTDRETAQSKIQRSLSLHMNGKTQKALKTFTQGLDINPYLEKDTFTKSVAGELTGLDPNEAIRILKDPQARQELLNPGKESKPKPTKTGKEEIQKTPSKPGETGKSTGEIPLVQIWLRFFKMTEDFFQRIVVQANTEDTLIAILVYMIASMLTFLISSFGQLQRMTDMLGQELGGQVPDLSPFLLGILISMIFLTPLSFFFGAGIQFLGMRVFGGRGTFKQHSYILAMIIVPMTILSLALTLPALVPGLNCIAGLAGLGLSIFSIVIMVRAMKVVHNLPTGKTIAGLIVPPLVLGLIGGCLMTLLGSALMGMLGNMIGVQG